MVEHPLAAAIVTAGHDAGARVAVDQHDATLHAVIARSPASSIRDSSKPSVVAATASSRCMDDEPGQT